MSDKEEDGTDGGERERLVEVTTDCDLSPPEEANYSASGNRLVAREGNVRC
jgi:hypothetical protein